ncbi:PAS domain S-box protein [bacterium]|nr:PAS domain S-box protein [bacterium]
MPDIDLRNNTELLRILFDYAPDAYYLTDFKGNFIDGNKEAERIIGYNKEELVSRNIARLKILSPSEIKKATKLLQQNLKGKPTGPDEFTLKRKDGSKRIVEIRTFPVKFYKHTMVLGIARDITVRKHNELKLKRANENLNKVQCQLIHSEKIAALSRFASGISHELKNPLGIILSGVEYLEKRPQVDEKNIPVIINKIKNAMPNGGTMEINLIKKEKSEAFGNKKSKEIVIEIIDNGVGMKQEVLNYAFEPFYTTKLDDKSIGLGLSIAKSFVNNHDGEIKLQSKPGEGTTVRIVLPQIENE